MIRLAGVLGSLAVMGLSSWFADVTIAKPSTPVFADHFKTLNASMWQKTGYGTNVTVRVSDGQARLSIPKSASADPFRGRFRVGLASRCTVTGDFDIRASYALERWPKSNGIRLGLVVSPDPSLDVAMHGEATVERTSFSSSEFRGAPREVYLTRFRDNVKRLVGTRDRSGKLRMVRKGKRFTGFYYSSKRRWTTIHSNYGPTGRVFFGVEAWGGTKRYVNVPAEIGIDNYVVQSGKIGCPPAPPPTPTVAPTPTAAPTSQAAE